MDRVEAAQVGLQISGGVQQGVRELDQIYAGEDTSDAVRCITTLRSDRASYLDTR